MGLTQDPQHQTQLFDHCREANTKSQRELRARHNAFEFRYRDPFYDFPSQTSYVCVTSSHRTMTGISTMAFVTSDNCDSKRHSKLRQQKYMDLVPQEGYLLQKQCGSPGQCNDTSVFQWCCDFQHITLVFISVAVKNQRVMHLWDAGYVQKLWRLQWKTYACDEAQVTWLLLCWLSIAADCLQNSLAEIGNHRQPHYGCTGCTAQHNGLCASNAVRQS